MKEEDHIIKKLNDLKRDTFSLDSAPFKVPENYFDSFEQKVLDKLKDQAEDPHADTLPPDLAKFPAYTVPEHYFDQLPDRLLQKINKRRAKIFRLPIWQKIAAAVIIGVIIILAATFYFTSPRNDSTMAVQLLSSSSIQLVGNADLDRFMDDGYAGMENNSQKDIDMDQLFRNINNKDLELFLDENTPTNINAF